MYRSNNHRFARNDNQSRQNIPTNSPHQQLIDYIYSTVDLSRFKYEIIQFESELPKLIKQKYFISPNFFGANTLLVFTKFRDRYYTYTVDRKTLSYNQSKIDIDKVKLDTHTKVRLSESVYAGSIFDGTIIKRGNETTFIITDVYYFEGQDYTKIPIDRKLFTVRKYLESNYNANDRMNNLNLTVNKLYEMTEVDNLVKTVIPNTKDFQIRGLCFYPDISGVKQIYLFGNDTKDSQQASIQSQMQYQSKPKLDQMIRHTPSETPVIKPTSVQNDDKHHYRYKYINKTDKEVIATLEIKGTEAVDVYNLYAVEKTERNGKKVLRRVKMGIAFVPGISRSAWCREILEKSGGNSVLVKCKFDNDKSKWEPFDIDKSAKRPTMLDTIENDLELMEISDSE